MCAWLTRPRSLALVVWPSNQQNAWSRVTSTTPYFQSLGKTKSPLWHGSRYIVLNLQQRGLAPRQLACTTFCRDSPRSTRTTTKNQRKHCKKQEDVISSNGRGPHLPPVVGRRYHSRLLFVRHGQKAKVSIRVRQKGHSNNTCFFPAVKIARVSFVSVLAFFGSPPRGTNHGEYAYM